MGVGGTSERLERVIRCKWVYKKKEVVSENEGDNAMMK